MPSVKKNFGYNLVLTFCNYLFPLITYPYINRVLGVENIGVCGFVDSIINYFLLFSMLGVGSLGVREIARTSEDKREMTQVFSSLIFINGLLTIVAIATLIVASYCVSSFVPYQRYLYIGVLKLLFNIIYIDWFFQGIQNFKYITNISIVLRVIYTISLFVFIHNPEDTLLYFFITTMVTVVNSVVNWAYSKKYIDFTWNSIKPKLYIVPILIFGYYRILTSMYTVFNGFYLGVKAGPIEVGYFTTATKINTLIMAIFTAFTTVMIPKVAELMKKGDKSYLQDIATKTFSLVIALSMPVICLCFFCAPQIIFLIAGAGFEGAILPFRIIVSLILIIGIEQIVVQQFLMATNSNRSVSIVSTVGALVGLSLNFLLTPNYASVGSAISWGVSELSVMIVGIILLRKYTSINFDLLLLGKGLILSLLYFIPLFIIGHFLPSNSLLFVIISLLLIMCVFYLINFVIIRDSYIKELSLQFLLRFKNYVHDIKNK